MSDITKTLDSLHPVARAALAAVAVCLVGVALIRLQASGTVMPMDAGLPERGGAMPHGERSAAPQVAPAWTLEDAAGASHTLADLAGRPVLLNFWASWCPPCLDEMPSLQGLVGAMADTELAVVAVTLDENWADAQLAMQRTGFGEDVLVLIDADGAMAATYGTHKVPETYLVDPQGRIVHRFVGPREWDDPQLVSDVRAFATRHAAH